MNTSVEFSPSQVETDGMVDILLTGESFEIFSTLAKLQHKHHAQGIAYKVVELRPDFCTLQLRATVQQTIEMFSTLLATSVPSRYR